MTTRKTTPPAKKKFRVQAEFTEYFYFDVDAASEAEAEGIGWTIERDNFIDTNSEWCIAAAEELVPGQATFIGPTPTEFDVKLLDS